MWSVGIDVHKKASQLCVKDEAGTIVLEKAVRTRREELAKHLGAFEKAKVVLESSTSSEWVARYLESLDFEVIVADPGFAAMYSTRTRKVKNDKRDARALSDACATGMYRRAHRVSDEQQRVREQLGSRAMLVAQRSRLICRIKVLLEREGLLAPQAEAAAFRRRICEQGVPQALAPAIRPLLEMLAMAEDQIRYCDASLERLAVGNEIVRRLMTVPGVGVIVALAFVSVLDSHKRFQTTEQVASYLGIIPSESTTGMPDDANRGHITRAGNPFARLLLVQAAWALLHSKDGAALPLQQWFAHVAAKRGKGVAIVGLARKLSGILFVMWRDGTAFDPERTRPKPKREQPTRKYQLTTKAGA